MYILILAASCSPKQTDTSSKFEKKPPSKYVDNSIADIATKNDTVFVNGLKFSGFLFELYPNTTDTMFIDGYVDGLLNGTCKKWHPNKKIMEERFYANGRKEGAQISYWDNGNKRFEFIAKNDVYEGELKEWTYDGNLFHLANFTNGQEEGPQKMWYDNGKIRANYVIKNGKRYGLLGTKNCKNVSDSIFNND